jgi:glycosyltransferase involved in cell wall biosynthesis
MTQPFISIVIANFNYGRFLEEAIMSVLEQSCQDFELIIVDGGSTDNSVSVIKKYEDKLAWWCSEKDRGQSHAFNKGFAQAKGRFLTWLNADDVMFPGALSRVQAAINRYPEAEWFAAGGFWLDMDMRVIKCSRAQAFSSYRAQHGNLSVYGPSSFFTKRLWELAGHVDTDFHYMMDTELWNRFYFNEGVKYRVVDGYCWGLRLHPDAKMSGHNFASSPLFDLSHPAWKQRQTEATLLVERYRHKKMPIWGRAVSVRILTYLWSRYDSFRFAGKCYRSLHLR